MCVECCIGQRKWNKILPFEDLVSERVEIRPNRFLRILHWRPITSTPDGTGSFSTNSTTREGRSASIDSHDIRNIVAIFFIHGVGGCAELWHQQLRHFCKAGYEVVAPDLLGHGESSAPRDYDAYDFSELSKDMLAVFDRYARKRNILVGHSYGSSFCSLISAKRTRLVSKVVFIAGGGPVPLRPDTCHLFCLPIPLLAMIRPLLFCSFERKAFYNRSAVKSSGKKFKAFSAPLYVLKAVVEGQNWIEGGVAFHNNLMVPVLLIYGARDKFVTLEEEQSMLEAVYGSSLEVISDAGHMVMVESPEKVNWFIHNFLQRDPTTRSTTILSHSRELSQASIHVRYNPRQSHTASRSQSLATASRKGFPFEISASSKSASELPRHSVTSLGVPGQVNSCSLPGNGLDLKRENEECKARVKLKVHEIEFHTGNSSKDCSIAVEEKVVNEQHEGVMESKDRNGETLTKYPKDGVVCRDSSSDSGSPSRHQRPGAVSPSRTGPVPSQIETHL